MRLRREGELWVKRASSRRTFDQEVRGLTEWRCGRMPVLVDADPTTLELRTEVLVGGAFPSLEVEAWREAGAWRRAFAQEADEDELPLSAALQKRLRSWSRKARLEAEELQALLGLWSGDHEGVRRVRCHRDYQPRNWLWNEGIAALDFEHAAPDHPLMDVVKVLDHLDPDDERFQAFLGAPLSPREQLQLRDLRILHALGCLGWGRGHPDPVYVELGRQVMGTLQG